MRNTTTIIAGIIALAVIVAAISYVGFKDRRNNPAFERPGINTAEMKNKPILPVAPGTEVGEMESGNIIGNGFDYTSLPIPPMTPIVSPFDGEVSNTVILPQSEAYGAEARYISIRSENGTYFHIILPPQSRIVVEREQRVVRGQKLALYEGGNLGGSSSKYNILMTYEDKLGSAIPLGDDNAWANKIP